MRGGDGGRGENPRDGQVPNRRRRAGAARGAVRPGGGCPAGGRGGGRGARPQGLARWVEPQGQQDDPATRLPTRVRAEGGASAPSDRDQRWLRRSGGGASATRVRRRRHDREGGLSEPRTSAR